jgi:hypothetical protein
MLAPDDQLRQGAVCRDQRNTAPCKFAPEHNVDQFLISRQIKRECRAPILAAKADFLQQIGRAPQSLEAGLI